MSSRTKIIFNSALLCALLSSNTEYSILVCLVGIFPGLNDLSSAPNQLYSTCRFLPSGSIKIY